MCMGLGCNAAGVVGTKIIDSPREKLIAILTNSFMPCNRKISIFNYNINNIYKWLFFRTNKFTNFYNNSTFNNIIRSCFNNIYI